MRFKWLVLGSRRCQASETHALNEAAEAAGLLEQVYKLLSGLDTLLSQHSEAKTT
jgi:hypothetical protein